VILNRGCARPLARYLGNSGTAMIPQYRFNKSNTHTLQERLSNAAGDVPGEAVGGAVDATGVVGSVLYISTQSIELDSGSMLALKARSPWISGPSSAGAVD